MKTSRLPIVFAGIIFGLLAVCWSLAQNPTHPLTVIDPTTGKEIHTLMVDQHNALLGQLEAAGQMNAIELFRQYRCASASDLASAQLKDTVAVLQYLRKGDESKAIRILEQRVSAYANLMVNSYGGLNPANRERVNLEPLKQAQDYFAKFPPPAWNPEMDKAVSRVLRPSETPKK